MKQNSIRKETFDAAKKQERRRLQNRNSSKRAREKRKNQSLSVLQQITRLQEEVNWLRMENARLKKQYGQSNTPFVVVATTQCSKKVDDCLQPSANGSPIGSCYSSEGSIAAADSVTLVSPAAVNNEWNNVTSGGERSEVSRRINGMNSPFLTSCIAPQIAAGYLMRIPLMATLTLALIIRNIYPILHLLPIQLVGLNQTSELLRNLKCLQQQAQLQLLTSLICLLAMQSSPFIFKIFHQTRKKCEASTTTVTQNSNKTIAGQARIRT